MSDRLQELRERGQQGLDLSPGDATSKWAHDEIVRLRAWRTAAINLADALEGTLEVHGLVGDEVTEQTLNEVEYLKGLES